jgi:MT0933-like antitoxin protein
MGFLDDAKDRLGDVVDEHGDQVSDGIDKAAEFIGDKTGGKYDDKIEMGAEKAKDALDSLDGKNDDLP